MAALETALVQVTPFQQNCAIVWDGASRRGAVVDPGGDVARILAAIERRGVDVEKILLTHGHLDHAGGAEELRAALSQGRAEPVPIEGPDRRDKFLLDNIERQAAAFGLAGMGNAAPDRWLAEGDHAEIGGHRFAVLHCPGHTPGHIVLVNPDARFAIVGDVLFRGSIGRTDFPYGDHAQLLRAIAEKLLPLGDDVAFVCGHGPASTIGEERRTNPFLQGGA
ncbi:MAG: MBL fold metallo-hydrolase [Alphaproteobacteria bacterium]|nr:MBL fold metallo-hydrolase [Alphaproteobacteria bacterium]